MLKVGAILALALASATVWAAEPEPASAAADSIAQSPVAAPSAPTGGTVATVITQRASATPGTILIEHGTMVRLMVVNEVNSRTAKAGERFALRVDEDVVVGGVKIIPVGATAWGEISAIKEAQEAAKAGQVEAKLLYAETSAGQVPLAGERAKGGPNNGAGLGMAIWSFGPFGLLMKGNAGRLKAGDIFDGYFAEDMSYDLASHKLAAAPATAAATTAPVAPTPVAVSVAK